MSNKHIVMLNTLKGSEFWEYVLKFKHELKVVLDNDDTWVEPLDKSDDDEVATANWYLGNSDGICDLLEALEVNHEHC